MIQLVVSLVLSVASPSLPEETSEDALLLGRSGAAFDEEEVVLGSVVDPVGTS